MILISACLVGINCKYNGKNNYNEKALELVKSGKAIPICSEQLGGLTTPRNPSEIKTINNKRYVNFTYLLFIYGVPEAIRTPDTCLRRAVLYPAELRRHICLIKGNILFYYTSCITVIIIGFDSVC